MTSRRWLFGLLWLGVFGGVTPVAAQFPIYPVAGGFISYHHNRFGAGFGVSSYHSYYGSYGFAPAWYGGNPNGYPWGQTVYNFPINQIVVVAPVPSVPAVPIIVIQQPAPRDERDFLVIAPKRRRPLDDAPPRMPAQPQPPPNVQLPGVDAGRFRPIAPGEREQVRKLAPFELDEGQRAPFDEYEQLIRQANAAFAAGEYNRAARRAESATNVLPQARFIARAYVQLGLARFAMGQYQEAVTAFDAVVRLDPEWPGSNFRVRTAYADNPERFDEQFDRLERIRARRPDDPILLFLSGCLMWFDTRSGEARPLLRRAFERAPELTIIQRFLDRPEAPPVPPAAPSPQGPVQPLTVAQSGRH